LSQRLQINVLLQIHASQDGFHADRVPLVAECVIPQEVDVLAGDERDLLQKFQGLLVARRLVVVQDPREQKLLRIRRKNLALTCSQWSSIR
jgi:hypothetical protein